MPLNHATDVYHVFVSQIPVLICSLEYTEHGCHC